MQCLKVYSDTGEVKNLYNAAKCAAQPHTQALSSHRPPMGAGTPLPSLWCALATSDGIHLLRFMIVSLSSPLWCNQATASSGMYDAGPLTPQPHSPLPLCSPFSPIHPLSCPPSMHSLPPYVPPCHPP